MWEVKKKRTPPTKKILGRKTVSTCGSVRASGFHRELVQRLPASEARLLCVMILNAYLHPWNKKRLTYAQIAEDLGGVCPEGLLLQSLQRTPDDDEYWHKRLYRLRKIMCMTSGLRVASSRGFFFADPNVRAMLRSDCQPAPPFADHRRRLYKSGLYDVLLQRAGKLDPGCDASCVYVMETLFATRPESRRAVFVFEALWASADSDIMFLSYMWDDWRPSLADHFQDMFTKQHTSLLSCVCSRMRTSLVPLRALPAREGAEGAVLTVTDTNIAMRSSLSITYTHHAFAASSVKVLRQKLSSCRMRAAIIGDTILET